MINRFVETISKKGREVINRTIEVVSNNEIFEGVRKMVHFSKIFNVGDGNERKKKGGIQK